MRRRRSKASLRRTSRSTRRPPASACRRGRAARAGSRARAQQPLDEGRADEAGRSGDGDALAGEGLGDHGHHVYHVLYQMVDNIRERRADPRTHPRRGARPVRSRGVDGVSLDEIAAAVGVRKQTVLYWFSSKEELVDAVLGRDGQRVGVVIDAAVRCAGRAAGPRRRRRRGRVPHRRAAPGGARARPRAEPAAGGAGRPAARARRPADRSRRRLPRARDGRRPHPSGDPRLVAALAYATVTGIATEPEALRGVGWTPTRPGLRSAAQRAAGFLRPCRRTPSAPRPHRPMSRRIGTMRMNR